MGSTVVLRPGAHCVLGVGPSLATIEKDPGSLMVWRIVGSEAALRGRNEDMFVLGFQFLDVPSLLIGLDFYYIGYDH